MKIIEKKLYQARDVSVKPLLYGVFTHYTSLREIQHGLEVCQGKLNHLNLRTEFTFTWGEVSNASHTFGDFGGEAYWVGKNLKIYSQAWGGNGFTGGKNAVKEFAEGMGKVANPLGVITSIASVGEAVYDVSQGHYEAAGVHSLDAVMGAVCTFGGPVGWAVSGVYFISRFWWGNDDD